jgi:hypothetical protein
MYTKNDIMARLQKGDDPQAIANEIADTLNAALAEYEESQKAAKEKEAAAKREAEKQKDMSELCDLFWKYMNKYYDWEEGEFSDEDVREIIEATEAAMLAATELKSLFSDFAKKLDEDMDEQPAKLHHEAIPNTKKCECAKVKSEETNLDNELHQLLKQLLREV